MLGMIEVGLIERAPLPSVDRSGIAVAEALETGCIEGADLPTSAVELHGERGAVDRCHSAGRTVVEPELFLGAGELKPITGGK